MSRLFDAGQALARHLVVDRGYVPLEQALPGLQSVSQSFDAALAAFEGPDLYVQVMLLDEDARGPEAQAEGLRTALESQQERIPGRIKAYAWLLVGSAARAKALGAEFLKFEDGHFLSKTLVGRGILCLDSGEVWTHGRVAPQPSAQDIAAHLDPLTAPDEFVASRQIALRQADERQARRLLKGSATPVTWALIAVNIAVYLWQSLVAASMAPSQGPDQAWQNAVIQLGANDPALTFAQGQWWRLLAACFLHASLPHIVLNMLSLFSLGSLAERLTGPWRFLGLYLLAGIAASGLSAALGKPGIPSLGASGAIVGVAGALLAPYWRRDPRFPKDLSARLFSWLGRPIAFLFVLGFGLQALDLSLQLDNFAHLGGLLSGFALAYIYPPFLIRKTDRKG